MKCIDSEIPFDIPSGWEWVRLADVATYIHRGKSPRYSLIKKYPVIAQKCNQWDGFSIEKALFIDPQTITSYSNEHFLQDEDLLWNSTGLGTLGRMAIYRTRLNPYELAVADSHVTVIRLLKTMVAPSFFYLYFSSPTVQNVIEDKADGSTKQKELSTNTVCNYLIPLPPLNEQKRIVDQYEQLLQHINKYSKTQTALDELNTDIYIQLKKAILQEAIQGKLVPQDPTEGTAEELLQQIKAEKVKLVKEGKLKKQALADSIIYKGDDNRYWEKLNNGTVKCIDDEIPFDIPEKWIWTRLDYIAEIYTGNSISESEKKLKYTNVVGREYIGTKDVGFDCAICYNNGVAIPKRFESEFRFAPKSSVLMCVEGGSAGRKIAMTDRDVCFGNKLCCFAPYIDIHKYVFYYLQAPAFLEMFNAGKTGIIEGVGVNNLKKLLIPLPPLKEQCRIVTQVEGLFEKLQ